VELNVVEGGKLSVMLISTLDKQKTMLLLQCVCYVAKWAIKGNEIIVTAVRAGCCVRSVDGK